MLQRFSGARGQTQCKGDVGLLEVVDVTPVVRGRFAGRTRFDQATHERVFARSAGTERKDVVALALDGNAKLERFDSAILADKVYFLL